MSDSLIRSLGELPLAEPDIVRTEHISKRCRAHLGRRARRGVTSAGPPIRRPTLPIWQSLIAVLGFVYLAEVIRFALDVYARA
jgi:hypothetical protein